jgi:hypothetical protein
VQTVLGVGNIQKNTVQNVFKIVKCLKEAENGWLWATEISKRSGIHRTTVTRLIELYLSNFVEEQKLEPSNIRMFKLKQGIEPTSILRFLSVREKINRALGK